MLIWLCILSYKYCTITSHAHMTHACCHTHSTPSHLNMALTPRPTLNIFHLFFFIAHVLPSHELACFLFMQITPLFQYYIPELSHFHYLPHLGRPIPAWRSMLVEFLSSFLSKSSVFSSVRDHRASQKKVQCLKPDCLDSESVSVTVSHKTSKCFPFFVWKMSLTALLRRLWWGLGGEFVLAEYCLHVLAWCFSLYWNYLLTGLPLPSDQEVYESMNIGFIVSCS